MQKYEHGRLVNIGEIYKISRIRMGSDGPGMSTLVAFRECQLKCVYCLNEHCHVLQAMLEEVDKKIAGADYSASFVALQKDVSIYQKEYAEVLDNKWEKRPLKEKKVLKNGMYQYEYDNAIDTINTSREKDIGLKNLIYQLETYTDAFEHLDDCTTISMVLDEQINRR